MLNKLFHCDVDSSPILTETGGWVMEKITSALGNYFKSTKVIRAHWYAYCPYGQSVIHAIDFEAAEPNHQPISIIINETDQILPIGDIEDEWRHHAVCSIDIENSVDIFYLVLSLMSALKLSCAELSENGLYFK